MAHAHVWLAVDFRGDRPDGICLAGSMADAVSPSPRTSACVEPGTGIHPQRSIGNRGTCCVAPSYSLSTDVGFCYREIHDRSHLVDLPFLASGFFEEELRRRFEEHRSS